ncbi:MAG: hypothetical protein IJU03_04370 [Thermoguttaceae bacterium]|nr:hypothetical protein [Thermoguttaceae bacterium]
MTSHGKKALTAFVEHWNQQKGYEKGETHQCRGNKVGLRGKSVRTSRLSMEQ